MAVIKLPTIQAQCLYFVLTIKNVTASISTHHFFGLYPPILSEVLHHPLFPIISRVDTVRAVIRILSSRANQSEHTI